MKSAVLFLAAEAATSSASGTGGVGIVSTIIYFVVIIAVFYFILIRPQKKQQKEHDALVAGVEIGDSIVTSSGFYGVVIDVSDQIVVVEFGSNKNCRIPMQKQAISEIEKANAQTSIVESKEDEKADKKPDKKKVKE